MDIANYVGLFLLKNEYCFLPGIGSLIIEKKPAVYNKETQQMSSPVHEVYYRQDGGSIDDSFANFIATNERISIAHASNHLKDFCARAKADLREGKSVTIPGIGSLKSDNNNIRFEKDAALQIEGKAIPYFRNSEAVTAKKEEAISNIIERTSFREPKANEEIEYKAPSVNWGKISILAGIAVVIVAAAIFIFMSFNKNKAETAAPAVDTTQQATPPPPVQSAPVTPDSTTATKDTSVMRAPATAATNADGNIQYKVALNSYPTRKGAEGRVAKLKSFGHSEVELFAKDSNTFFVVIPVTSAAADTAKIVDSLRRLYNPKGTLPIIR
jgi:nucleoid DNA-binding protein